MSVQGSNSYVHTFFRINSLLRQFKDPDRHDTRNSESSIPFNTSTILNGSHLILRHRKMRLSTGASLKKYNCEGMSRTNFSHFTGIAGELARVLQYRGRSNGSSPSIRSLRPTQDERNALIGVRPSRAATRPFKGSKVQEFKDGVGWEPPCFRNFENAETNAG